MDESQTVVVNNSVPTVYQMVGFDPINNLNVYIIS